MKTTPLSIDRDILKKMTSMSSDDMHELIVTVGLAVSLNEELHESPQDKIVIAISALEAANAMLEQCGCQVELQISNPAWTDQIQYITSCD